MFCCIVSTPEPNLILVWSVEFIVKLLLYNKNNVTSITIVNLFRFYAFNPIRSGVFEKVNDLRGGGEGGPKPPPLRFRKLLYQSSPCHAL